MLLTLSGRAISNSVQFFSVFPRGVPLPHIDALQYYAKREKCKVNDVIFPSGCEAREINLDNENMKIGIFTGGTMARSKNISFTAVSRYPTGKHEIMVDNGSIIHGYDHLNLRIHLLRMFINPLKFRRMNFIDLLWNIIQSIKLLDHALHVCFPSLTSAFVY